MRSTYKNPLTVKQQADYLEQNKRVIFGSVNRNDAEQYLYEHCYINVITPFKHCFAKRDPVTGVTIRDANNNHVYERDIDFSEYKNKYEGERDSYPTIYKNIMQFESTLNSIVANEVIHSYHIDSYEKFTDFRGTLLKNAQYASSAENVVAHLRDEINSFYYDMKRYEDIYIFIDRLSLSGTIAVWKCSDNHIKKKIFKELMASGMTFQYTSLGTFNDFLERIVPIRNCVCHFNSLEVLINYYDIKNKSLRRNSDKKKYINIIAKLSV
ncbi:MAG: hypothetical protein LKF62_04980 [Solobacterium sp.]|jgi:hypothetical protein|nr:hypothetical protein [Solobacterium sp.]